MAEARDEPGDWRESATGDTLLASSRTDDDGPRDHAEQLLQAQILNALFGEARDAPRLGRYVYLKQLGEGGMGVVCAAYDPKLDRKVAIKLIRSSATESPERRARMVREAQAMARLSHPNVVQIYEIAELDDELCVVMEYLDGVTVGEWTATARRSWREVIACYLQIAAGLAAAHAEGVIHRDVKPDNAIITDDGRVRVLDFGLAQTEEPRAREAMRSCELASLAIGEPLKTRTGALLGTPAYMSPEHVEGRKIDARSDQFSLCAALYEALYGVRPFRGETLAELITALLDGAPEPPPGNTVPAWVHAIVLRGLARNPEDRWPALADLIAALRADPAVRRRQRLWIGGGIALAAGAALTGWMAYDGSLEARAAQARAAASEAEARTIEAQSAAALRESYLGSLSHTGYLELRALDHPLRALVMLNEVYRARPDDLHVRELLAVASRPADALEWSIKAHSAPITVVATSADGALVASADHHTVRVWDAATGEPVARCDGLARDVTALRFSRDGARLVATSRAGDVWSWSPRTGALQVHMAGGTHENYAPISPDATRVARVADGLSGIEIVDVVGGELVTTLPVEAIYTMAWSGDGSHLAIRTFTADERWDLRSGERVSAHPLGDVTFGDPMADGRNVKYCDDGVARFVDVRERRAYVRDSDGRELALDGELADKPSAGGSYQFVLDPAGRWVAIAEPDGHLNLWELPSGKLRVRVRHSSAAFEASALSDDRTRIALASVDGVVRILDVKTGAQLTRLDGHDGGASALAFTPDGASLVSATSRGATYRWSARPQGLRARLDGALLGTRADAGAVVLRDGEKRTVVHPGGDARPVELPASEKTLAASFSPDGAMIATAIMRDDAAAIELYAASDGAKRGEIALPFARPLHVDGWSADGSWLLVPGNGGALAVVDVRARSLARQLAIESVALVPEVTAGGERLAALGMSYAPPQLVLHLWDTRSWDEVAKRTGELQGSMHGINHAGTTLAWTGVENTPELIDLASGEPLLRMRDPDGPLPPFVFHERYRFSHDDALIASAHVDGSVRLWRSSDGALSSTLRGHGTSITSVAIDPAGPRLASCSRDGAAIVWSTETGARLSTLDPAPVALTSIEFMADGAHAVAVGADNATRLWHIETGRLIAVLDGA
ncbi:MAG: protein kinase, partial [Myxococcales bacterium]|nr:protein kinase [Myxococcales bacterium]